MSDLNTNLAGRLIPALSAPFMSDAPYLVKNWLRRGQTSMVYGPSNVGKSFFVFDLVYHITTGQDWNGCRINQGTVLYIATEDYSGLGQRIKALKVTKGFPTGFQNKDWLFLAEKVDLYDCTHVQELISGLGGLSFDLIVIDTLAMAMGSGNENDNTTINAFLRNLAVLRGNSDTHIMLVHHTGKEQDRGARGHSSLQAAVDTEILLKNDDGLISVNTTKQRDYVKADKIHFYLESVVLGKDADGDDVTSCIVKYTSKTDRPKKLNQNKRILLDVLKSLLKTSSHTHTGSAEIVSGTKVVDGEVLKSETLAGDKLSPESKQDSRRRIFDRTLKDLIAESHVLHGLPNWYWLPNADD